MILMKIPAIRWVKWTDELWTACFYAYEQLIFKFIRKRKIENSLKIKTTQTPKLIRYK